MKADVLQLALVHNFYRSVYSAEPVARMNEIAPTAFRIIQRALVNEQLRLICAITDPEGTGARKNLVLARVLAEIQAVEQSRQPDGANCHAKCIALNDELGRCLQPIRELRNKLLSHSDMQVKAGHVPAPKVSTDEFDKAVELICSIMERAAPVLNDGVGIGFSYASDGQFGSGALRWLLSDGQRFKQLRELAQREATDPERLKKMVACRSNSRNGGVKV